MFSSFFTRLLFLLALSLTFSFAATSPTFAKEKTKTYKRMPWHLIDTYWHLGKVRDFESLSMDVTISKNIPSSLNLYIAPIGMGHISGSMFYGGIQTNSDGKKMTVGRRQSLGPGLLFSMWNERRIEAIRPSVGAYYESSGHEGDFISVRRPFKWRKGKFTYRICKMDAEVIEGKPYVWVGAFLYSHESKENIFIGSLRFKGKDLKIHPDVANFVELYGRAIPVSKIPKLTITFSNPRINGQAIKNPRVKALYPQGVPDYADAKFINGEIVIQIGTEVKNRKHRQVQLSK